MSGPLSVNSSSNPYSYDTESGTTVQPKPGESLEQIAQRLDVDPKALAQANPQIKDPKSALSPFQKIEVPHKLQAQLPNQDSGDAPNHHVGQSKLAPRPTSDPDAATAMKARLSTAGPASPKPAIDPETRRKMTADLTDKAATIPGIGPKEMLRIGQALVSLPASEFRRQADKIADAMKSGDSQAVMRAVSQSEAAGHAVNTRGGGTAIQAKVEEHADGYHFDFDRPLSKEQAAALIFQGGKVPDGDQLEKGPGNNWVVKVPPDMTARQNTASHFNSHTETVGYKPSSDPAISTPTRDLTFTFVQGAPHEPTPASNRKDINNNFGFKVTKAYDMDQGGIPRDQLKALTGQGVGYEVHFDKPMTKDEVMGKLFQDGVNKHHVQLEAVPKEPSDVYQVKIVDGAAASQIKGPYVDAFSDAAYFSKTNHQTLPPETPPGLRQQFDSHTIPPGAKKFPPDAYVWEKDGYIAYVKTDGKNYYSPQLTKIPADKPGANTIKYFMEEKGLAPKEAWKAFANHWDDLNRQMLMALMSFYGAASEAIPLSPGAPGIGEQLESMGSIAEKLAEQQQDKAQDGALERGRKAAGQTSE